MGISMCILYESLHVRGATLAYEYYTNPFLLGVSFLDFSVHYKFQRSYERKRKSVKIA
jgi:hypothetical protein